MNSKKVYLGVSRKIFLVFTICLMGWTLNLKAQCYGVVQFDSKVDTGGATGTTFKITTANPNELILIGYNGWFGPGSGPVNVDGNPATHINTAHVSNSACAEVYCYSAPLAGVHTIVCTESGYSSPYYLNFAASFYVTGTCTPLSCADLITVETAVASGKVDTARITTTTPNEMIFCSAVYNTGIFPSNALIMSGVTNLGGLHEGNGIDASVGDTTATVAGTYTVATSDVNAAAGGGIVLVAIIPPLCGAALTLKDTMTNPTCNNNGIATDTPTGGTPPYTYLWSPGGNTNQTATGLSAGTYTVTVKDSVGCLSSATVTLTSNGPVVTAFNTKSVKCNGGADGEDSSSVKGGTSPYSYSWTPSGGTNAVTNGLSAGTYTITVTDKNGCTSSASASVTQPAGMTTSQVIVNNLCNGAANGKAVLSVSGGTGPYTYNWQPSGGSGSVATNLTAGTYTCTITDAGGCTTKDSATITQPPALKDTVTINPAVCGSNNGSASATASGGTGGYKYKWTPSGGTNASATGLSAGTYTITVTDANGCTKTTSVNISNIGGPSATSTKINVACNGGLTGSATAIATGGTSPYTYSWSPSGGTNATASGLSAGTYTCTVTDNKGCLTFDTVTITQPPVITDNITSQHSTCGTSDGSAKVTASGGTGSFTYSWIPGGNTNANITGLSAGTYMVTITDANGCSATASTLINNVGNIKLDTVCCDTLILTGQSAVLNVITGSPGYTYNWAPPLNLSCTSCPDPVASPSVTITYTVTVTDSNGCSVERQVTVTVESPCSDFNVPNIFTPNNDGINDDFVITIPYPSSFSISVFDRWGRVVYSSSNPTVYWNGEYNNSNYLVPDGSYYYVIKASCGSNNYVKKGFVEVLGSK